MGTWGTRIYEDDTALDIRGDFLDRHKQGMPIERIEQDIQSEYYEGDPEFDDVSKLALACVEMEVGVLTDHVKQEAQEVIASGRSYRRWLDECGKEDAALRKRELTLIKKYLDTYNGKPVRRKSWLELQRADKDYENEQQTKQAVFDALDRKNQPRSDASNAQSWMLSSVELLALAAIITAFVPAVAVDGQGFVSFFRYGLDHLLIGILLAYAVATLLKMPPGSAVGIFRPLVLCSGTVSGMVGFGLLVAQSRVELWANGLSVFGIIACTVQATFFALACPLVTVIAIKGIFGAVRKRR